MSDLESGLLQPAAAPATARSENTAAQQAIETAKIFCIVQGFIYVSATIIFILYVLIVNLIPKSIG